MIPQALELINVTQQEKRAHISMVSISGPGDPLATPDITLAVISQIRAKYPHVRIGLRTLGIGSDKLAGELAKAGLDYIEMEVNGVRADVLQKLYAWIRPGQKTLKIEDSVELLIKEQKNGVPALKFHDIDVVISTTLYPGYNTDHIVKVSSEMQELGADAIAITPYESHPEAEVGLETPSAQTIESVEEKASGYLKLVDPLLTQQNEKTAQLIASQKKKLLNPRPSRVKPNVAVVSSNGIDVDLHLGHAVKFLIYGRRSDGLACLLEARNAPKPGSGGSRWQQVSKVLNDCFVLLVASAGETPRKTLADNGLQIVITEDNIEGTVDVLYGGGKRGKK